MLKGKKCRLNDFRDGQRSTRFYLVREVSKSTATEVYRKARVDCVCCFIPLEVSSARGALVRGAKTALLIGLDTFEYSNALEPPEKLSLHFQLFSSS